MTTSRYAIHWINCRTSTLFTTFINTLSIVVSLKSVSCYCFRAKIDEHIYTKQQQQQQPRFGSMIAILSTCSIVNIHTPWAKHQNCTVQSPSLQRSLCVCLRFCIPCAFYTCICCCCCYRCRRRCCYGWYCCGIFIYPCDLL